MKILLVTFDHLKHFLTIFINLWKIKNNILVFSWLCVLQILSNIQIFQNIQCCKPFITSFTSFIFMVFRYIQNNGFHDVPFVHFLHETRQNICLSHQYHLPPAPLDTFFPPLSAPSSFMSVHMNVWLCFYLGADICLSFCSRDYLCIVWKSFLIKITF